MQMQRFLEGILEAIDAIHDGIIVLDRESRILFINSGYTRIIGVPKEKIVGRKLIEIEPESPLLNVLQSGKPLVNEVVYLKKAKRTIVATSTPVYHGGQIIGAVSVFKDATELNELKQALYKFEYILRQLQTELNKKEPFPPAFSSIVGNSPRIREAISLASKIASADCTVLILGESGVGKELFAQAIHYSSPRSRFPFVKVNAAAIPENLLESELFGYEEGAFTGAKKGGKPGKFELADGGTLFLDEIGDMSLATQAKLLRALQEKEIERVGGTKPIRLDVRVIAATNQDLEEMVVKGKFRQDLFYRLNVVSLVIPPLRERKEDIPLLVEKFRDQYAAKYKKEVFFSEEVMEIFQQYHWPGNVRELQNVVEHAIVVCTDMIITPRDLPFYLINLRPDVQVRRSNGIETKLREKGSLASLIAEIEREAIAWALKNSNYNKTRAIKTLGLSRRTFYQKLRKYGFE